MIKDILVNLSYGTSQDGVSNYAVSVAETFGAHVVGTAFYPAIVGGVDLSANFIRAQQAEAREQGAVVRWHHSRPGEEQMRWRIDLDAPRGRIELHRAGEPLPGVIPVPGVLGHAGGHERVRHLQQERATAPEHQRQLAPYAPDRVVGSEVPGVSRPRRDRASGRFHPRSTSVCSTCNPRRSSA